MNFRVKVLAACVLLCGLSSNAFAVVCTSTSSWGTLGSSSSRSATHYFGSSGGYADCYTFSLSAAANSFGGLVETDPWLNRLDIDVTSVSLFNGGVSGNNTTGSLFGADSSPLNFSFGGLSIGTYSLVVFTNVTRDLGLFSDAVSYRLDFGTSRGTTVAEPATLSILGLSLAAFGLIFRRRALRVRR